MNIFDLFPTIHSLALLDLSQPADRVFLVCLLFATAFGACIGSFLNVVVYRMPMGQSLIHPPSTCPYCKNKLAWYDNVPVFGWLWLRGKCRYCQSPISIQYPTVEAITAGLFAFYFLACFLIPHYRLDFPKGAAGIMDTWPAYAVHAVLIAALLSSTLIDARFFIIPPSIPYFAMLVAMIAYPLASFQFPELCLPSSPLPMAAGPHAGIALGGFIGIVLGIILANLGILKFDYEEVPEDEKADDKSKIEVKKEDAQPTAKTNPETEAETKTPILAILIVSFIIALIAGALVAQFWMPLMGLITFMVIMFYGLIFIPQSSEGLDEPDWQPVLNPRKMALKEGLFLLFPIAGMVLGGMLIKGEPIIQSPVKAATTSSETIEPSKESFFKDANPMPWNETGAAAGIEADFFKTKGKEVSDKPAKWYNILAGCFLGYLMGAGLVWGMRVLGTLGFGKEAMGLGDVHLLGAIGAVIGPMDILIVFFLAPFLGIIYTMFTRGLGQVVKVRFQEVPYGPHLCMASLILIFARTPVRSALASWFEVNLPGVLS